MKSPLHDRAETPPGVQAALARLPETAWVVVPSLSSDDTIVSETMIEIDGRQHIARRTQYVADDLLQRANTQQYNDSAGKRWGDGRIVARVPLNKWFSDLGKYVRQGDRDHMTWWLNREENRAFRTFKGKV